MKGSELRDRLIQRYLKKNCYTQERLQQLLSLDQNRVKTDKTLLTSEYILHAIVHIRDCAFCKRRAIDILECQSFALRSENKGIFLSMLATLRVNPRTDFNLFPPNDTGEFFMEGFAEELARHAETQKYIDFLLGRH